MTGLGVTIYTDEDVDVDLARQLRYHGYDAVSCQETGNHNRGPSDEWQLTFASGERRAILVHNIADYCELDADWQSIGKAHHGIIAAQRMPIAQLVHRVRRHFDTVPPQQQYNTLLYLARG